MKRYTHIKKLNEGHCYGNNPNAPMPQDILDMRIEDLLDKAASLDSEENAEYEALTVILNSLGSKILSGSHEGDSKLSDNSLDTVEVDSEESYPEEVEDGNTPSWAEEDRVEDEGQNSIENFKF